MNRGKKYLDYYKSTAYIDNTTNFKHFSQRVYKTFVNQLYNIVFIT